jgi:hypothetical protein
MLGLTHLESCLAVLILLAADLIVVIALALSRDDDEDRW